MRNTILSSLLASILMTTAFAETPRHFPQVSGKDLNNKPWNAPADFPGDRTLVVIGFEEEQQSAIDSWLEGMGVKNPSSGIAWIEMPLIDNPGMFMRWFINTGMKEGIPSKEVRSHVWTAYTDKKAFKQTCGILSEKTVYALVVDRGGQILAMESGDFSKTAAARLSHFLHP